MHPNDDTVSVARTVAASAIDGQSTYMGKVSIHLQTAVSCKFFVVVVQTNTLQMKSNQIKQAF